LHEPHAGIHAANDAFADHVEAMTLVQADVSLQVGLEIAGLLLGIGPRRERAQQLRAQTAALMVRLDAEKPQVVMRVARVALVHVAVGEREAV